MFSTKLQGLRWFTYYVSLALLVHELGQQPYFSKFGVSIEYNRIDKTERSQKGRPLVQFTRRRTVWLQVLLSNQFCIKTNKFIPSR